MLDKARREIDYLRLSITDRCNFRCVYCMPEKGVHCLERGEILEYGELLRLCRVFSSLGVGRFKITGGEPLVREGAAAFIGRLAKIPGVNSVTLTTNGALLSGRLDALARAGLGGVNISLDTLNAEDFTRITRTGRLADTLLGLERALSVPGLNVKLNCVVSEATKDQVVPLARLAASRALAVRFIEAMPIGCGKEIECCKEETVRAVIEREFGALTPCDRRLGNGPARYFDLAGFAGKIGFISAISHKFCDECNRVRLTADGKLKTCLQYAGALDLRRMLRSGAGDDEIRSAIVRAVYDKPASHHFTEMTDEDLKERLLMSRIGG